MTDTLRTRYGLKFHPFSSDVPASALWATPALESFAWRVEQLAREGGFALVTGVPGQGKSAALRLLVDGLAKVRDLRVEILSRPHSNIHDFYREIGELYGVPLSPHNRWAGSKVLRQRWHQHFETALFRPVLLVDEAQEVRSDLLTEIRMLASSQLDSRQLLTVVLSGDHRLVDRLREEDLLPLGSRIRVRLALEPATPDQLVALLVHRLDAAGNASLMSQGLVQALADHASGNPRALLIMASELLAAAAERELAKLDEKLFFEVFGSIAKTSLRKQAIGGRR
jgi:type II secretory pathway predicted ATPase ExeA